MSSSAWREIYLPALSGSVCPTIDCRSGMRIASGHRLFCASMNTGLCPRTATDFIAAHFSTAEWLGIVKFSTRFGPRVHGTDDVLLFALRPKRATISIASSYRPLPPNKFRKDRSASPTLQRRWGERWTRKRYASCSKVTGNIHAGMKLRGRCLACANCTMVCPTCFCNSVQDVTDLSVQESSRVRSWDSCFNPDFAQVHGGNYRSSVKGRYRQWLTHKFSSWFDQFDVSGCVGCGRCITWCPVGIDVTEEIAAIRQSSQQEKKHD